MTLDQKLEIAAERAPRLALAQAPGPAAVLAIITQAVEKGIPAETMESLQRMYHAEQDRAARLEFVSAKAKFQEDCPPIPRDQEHTHLTQAGTGKKARYSSFEVMLETMRPFLRDLGFTVGFDGSTDGDMLTVTCKLQHVNGHSETSSFTLPTKAKSPAMSEQHAYSGARSFAKRVTLADVTGITYTDPDPEEQAGQRDTITESQAADLRAMIEEIYPEKIARATAEKRVLAWMGADRIENILVRQYPAAIEHFRAKRGKK